MYSLSILYSRFSSISFVCKEQNYLCHGCCLKCCKYQHKRQSKHYNVVKPNIYTVARHLDQVTWSVYGKIRTSFRVLSRDKYLTGISFIIWSISHRVENLTPVYLKTAWIRLMPRWWKDKNKINKMSYGRPPPDTDSMVSLKVDNLTYRTTPEDLRRAFMKYGNKSIFYCLI